MKKTLIATGLIILVLIPTLPILYFVGGFVLSRKRIRQIENAIQHRRYMNL